MGEVDGFFDEVDALDGACFSDVAAAKPDWGVGEGDVPEPGAEARGGAFFGLGMPGCDGEASFCYLR
jgi:hypothetical protein